MAIFPCSNLFSDGKIQDLEYFYLMWTSWSSFLQQQQQQGLGLSNTHSQALGTAAHYQRLRHHCAAHSHSCCSYWLCCSEISDSMHERVAVSVRIHLVLAHIFLICYLDYYHRMAEIGKDLWRWSGLAPCSSKATRCCFPRLPIQVLKCLQGWKPRSLTAPVLSHEQRSVSLHTFVPGAAPPQVQDLAFHAVSPSPFPQPYSSVIY